MNKYLKILSLQVVMLVITYTNSYSMEDSKESKNIEGSNNNIINLKEGLEENNKGNKTINNKNRDTKHQQNNIEASNNNIINLKEDLEENNKVNKTVNNKNRHTKHQQNNIEDDEVIFAQNKRKRTSDIDSHNVDISNNQHSIPGIKYSDTTTAWEQWTKVANFEAIDVDGIEYKKFCNFCEKHELYSFKNGIDFFLRNIYSLAYSITDSNLTNIKKNKIYEMCIEPCWAFADFDEYGYETLSNYFESSCNLEEITKNWSQQERLFSIEEYGNITPGQLMLKKVISTIRKLQKELNLTKYSNNNNINNIPSDTTIIKIMDGFSFISNQLVQLTHDILFAINNKINEYKNKNISGEQLYTEFREYLINKITLPCINTINEALSYCVGDDGFILNNITFNINEDVRLNSFLKILKEDLKYRFLMHSKCSLVYHFSKLGNELYKKHQEFFNTFYENLNTMKEHCKQIKYKPIKTFFSTFEKEPNIIDMSGVNLCNYYHYYGSAMMRYIINNTTNINITNMANNYLNILLKKLKVVIKQVRHHLKIENSDIILSMYDKCNDGKYKDEIQYRTEYKQLLTQLQNIKHEVKNINYIDDIKQLFDKYEIKLKDDGTYDITVDNIQDYNEDCIKIRNDYDYYADDIKINNEL